MLIFLQEINILTHCFILMKGEEIMTSDNGVVATMPMAPAGYSGSGFGGFGGGFGWGNDIWLIIIILFAFGGFGGWGNGGNGGANGNALYPWLNQSQQVNDGFRDQMITSSVNGIQNSLVTGFSDVQNALCNGFAGVEAGANARQIANMQAAFANQTAMNQGFNSIASQLAQCCCDNRLATANLGSDIAREACATRTNDTQNTQAILNSVNMGIQSIKDQLCSDKLDQKNDEIAQLRSELMYARGQASQDVQTAAIQAGQRALANEVEQYVLPTPRPAFIVQNPNCCTQNYGCGCGMA